MANGVNKQIIVGNLGADADLRYTQKGTAVANFRIAASTYAGKNADGSAREHTEWFSCVLWGKRAESLAPSLTTGKRLYIEGETRTRSWEDEAGVTHYRTEVHVRELTFQPQGGGSNSRGDSSAPAPAPAAEPEPAPFDETEEIPF